MGTGDSTWWQSIRGVKLTAHPRLLMEVITEYSYLPIFIYDLFKSLASSSDCGITLYDGQCVMKWK